MFIIKIILWIFLVLYWNLAVAQANGEQNEPTPEYLDATFTSADAARVAAGFSDALIEDVGEDVIGRMTSTADLVFRGVVQSQAYVYDERGIPSTHTTFSVTEQLKGNHPAAELTLIQLGGPAASGSDKVMMVSTSRYFNVGEEELLFADVVQEAEEQPEQLSVLFRFRIYENQVYDEDGYGIILEPLVGGTGHRLMKSHNRNPAQRFSRINIGSHWLNKQFSGKNNSPDSSEGTSGAVGVALAADEGNSYSESVNIDTFGALLRQ